MVPLVYKVDMSYVTNKNENCLEKTRICEKETYLNLTMTMEHVYKVKLPNLNSISSHHGKEWGIQT